MPKRTDKTSTEPKLTIPSHITLLQRITLDATTAAEASGISRRQWDYWQRMGHLMPEETGNNTRRTYSLRTVIKAALMAQAMAQSVTEIAAAGELAEAFLVEHENTPPPVASDDGIAALIPSVRDAVKAADAHADALHHLLREIYRQA
jgi:DNA-binding transcriptional MerR regulator